LYSGSNSINAKMYFDVFESATLETVKVYTDRPGVRVVQLFNSNDNLLDEATVDIQTDTAVITLNFALTPGTDYYLTTDATINVLIEDWNANSPRLRRSQGNAVSYPYNVQDLLSITGSDQGDEVYYYFYDWTVSAQQHECISELVPVEVFYDDNIGIQTVGTAGVSIYPNPATDILHVTYDASFAGSRVSIHDVTGRLVSETILDKFATQTIATNALAAGLYTVKVKANGHDYVTKLVLQR